MKDFLKVLIVAILVFIVLVGVIILLGVALGYILTVIPCNVMVYVETGLLLGLIFILLNNALKAEQKKKELNR